LHACTNALNQTNGASLPERKCSSAAVVTINIVALPMPDPYRKYAEVTQDTNRVAEVITELNQFRSDVTSSDTAQNTNITNNTNAINSHVGSNGHPGIYTPSANQYYVESVNGNGSGIVQTIFTGSTYTLDLGGGTNNGGGFSSAGDYYQVPAGGTYVAFAMVRVTDGYGTSCNLVLQFHDSSTHGYYTGWNKLVAGGGNRYTAQYMRVASWGSGTLLRLYGYTDGPTMDLTMIFLSVWRIG
jgi:hypothetical protein